MDDLAINSEKGQKSLHYERMAIGLLENRWTHLQFIHTNKAMPAYIDGLIINGSEIYALAEVKTRAFNMDTFESWNYELQIASQKIKNLQRLCIELRTPLMLMLYIIPDNMMLVQFIMDADGQLTVPFRQAKKEYSQETINGGTIERINHYLSFEKATPIIWKDTEVKA